MWESAQEMERWIKIHRLKINAKHPKGGDSDHGGIGPLKYSHPSLVKLDDNQYGQPKSCCNTGGGHVSLQNYADFPQD